ncbi:rhamnosyltransferase [Enterobacter asburiae]|uniref:rhamnosyltransferase n=1 Tax=Enterobacter asburiae TaxID=61645 RepID=UPI0018C2E217|nr:rhamnosyltransferase [Enterobacter asburiae]MBG0638684.1 rhamnosyltransferase [Enterobacter asburiae]MDS1913098.1 rhamnosyltransferase [Enterobacter asburiae]
MTLGTSSIAAILVTFNPDLTIFNKVVISISEQVNKIIIIDNGSKNATEVYDIATDAATNLIFIKQTVNIGLASAQNLGIKYAKDNLSVDHIILFDQDSVINKEFTTNLLIAEEQLLRDGVKVGAIGPSFYDPENNKMYPATIYCGPFIKRVKVKNTTVEATFLIASGCLIRLEVLHDVGEMLDELFIDYIDVEWSLRAKRHGYKVFITPKALMAHTIGDKRISIMGRTISCHSPFRRYFLIRNSFKMVRLTYVPLGYKLREITFNCLRTVIGFITSSEKKKFLKYTVIAFKDGVAGNFGPCKYKI